MKKNISFLPLICLALSAHKAVALPINFNSIKAAFGGHPFKSTIQEDFPISNTHKKVCFNNPNGNLTITTQKNRNHVSINATISSSQEATCPVRITSNSSNPNELALQTTYEQNSTEKQHCTVHINAIIPEQLQVYALCNKGSIHINNNKNASWLETANGNICVKEANGKVRGIVHQKGSIEVADCNKELYVTTQKGPINLSGINNSINAQTQNGKININCYSLPKDGFLSAHSKSGEVAICLPKLASANINAHSEKGSCLSERLITLNSITTQLNKLAWNNFKKSMSGIIGNGETTIRLSSVNSNVRIS